MFTGIIQDIGTIAEIDRSGDWTAIIKTQKLPLDNLAIGASIGCDGCCLTVIRKEKDGFAVQISAETLARTTISRWQVGTRINLEPALKMGDELGGHIVTGHIDSVSIIEKTSSEGDSLRFFLKVPHEFARFVASKGSIALNGVSLTVNEVENDRFGVNIIPHTLQETTFGGLKPGDEVNFEVDLMARYAARLISQRDL